MLNHIGTQDIKTNRLLLRKIKESDYFDMYRYASKPEVARYVSWPVHKEPKQTKKLCKMWANEYVNKDRYNWAIVFNNRVIGNIDITKIFGDKAYIGWQIDNTFWNQGIMTEAATAVLKYMFEIVGIDTLYSSYIPENIGSGRVMEKIGMTPTDADDYYSFLQGTNKSSMDLEGVELNFMKLTNENYNKSVLH